MSRQTVDEKTGDEFRIDLTLKLAVFVKQAATMQRQLLTWIVSSKEDVAAIAADLSRVLDTLNDAADLVTAAHKRMKK